MASTLSSCGWTSAEPVRETPPEDLHSKELCQKAQAPVLSFMVHSSGLARCPALRPQPSLVPPHCSAAWTRALGDSHNSKPKRKI